ncbi:uncharacterized protein LOC133516703 [Cydia pomonella]|uniref:uncharacterized protein LOC133516703 n=1 Tax=Cydia pomonella TaxID=82600 RepID=UPI002ADE408C|nr:uncharacterized protein LOC133516703 [Cydia pomonella]
MFFKISYILFFCCLNFIRAHGTKAIDMDYFLSFLRNSNCSTKEGLQYCKENCHGVSVLCHKGECYCHQSVVDTINSPNVVASVDLMIAPKAPIPPTNEVQINISPQIVQKSDEEVPVQISSRRHQIAHFCPSLDIARKCIRKCIQLGKAAFCGKDHQCYCGHKYSSHDAPDKQDALEVYKEFSDMYAKYFGNAEPDTGSDENYDEFLKKKKLSNKVTHH